MRNSHSLLLMLLAACALAPARAARQPGNTANQLRIERALMDDDPRVRAQIVARADVVLTPAQREWALGDGSYAVRLAAAGRPDLTHSYREFAIVLRDPQPGILDTFVHGAHARQRKLQPHVWTVLRSNDTQLQLRLASQRALALDSEQLEAAWKLPDPAIREALALHCGAMLNCGSSMPLPTCAGSRGSPGSPAQHDAAACAGAPQACTWAPSPALPDETREQTKEDARVGAQQLTPACRPMPLSSMHSPRRQQAMNKDIELEGQKAIPTHPADPAAKGDAGKVVAQEVLQTPDYNAPPSEGAIKSTGPAADPGVGGALGQPPPAAREAGSAADASADNASGGDAELGENQGGGDQISDEMKPKH